MRVLLLLTILFFKPNLISLDLYELDFKDDYLNSGRTLMNLEFGLHDLEPNSSSKEMRGLLRKCRANIWTTKCRL